jgi:hypothetical protein
MPNVDAWTVQMHVTMSAEGMCRWNCDNPTFISGIMMILEEGKYCNPKMICFQFIISERWNVLWRRSNTVYGCTVTRLFNYWLAVKGAVRCY